MKNYPRIRRLSTLGIVHHQNFDYEFSPFRTDFVGEGGAGKSMISDLLQLICVGSKAFHSPTKGTEPRKPQTMVLRTEGKGTDMGYAFITIEKAENHFLIIGIYLESSGTSTMFIVQDGNNFDIDTKNNLIPFSKLLGVEDFQKNNTIFPINELKEYIQNNQNLTCESWERTSNYHKILFNNSILPIDLSLNNKTLENYAKIIQAFSRESLDISKSSSLQSFLFGDDKEKELIKKFYDTVEELQEDTKQFENNLEEIEILTTKQKQLSQLLDLKITKENHQTIFLKSSFHYYNYEISINSNQLKGQINDYYDSLKSLPLLKESIDEKIISIKTEIETTDPKWENAFKLKNELEVKNSQKKKFISWIQFFKCSQEELIAKFKKYHTSKDIINKINELQEILKSKNVLKIFKSNAFKEKNIVNQLDKIVEKLNTDLEFKNKLKALNNIDDKHSLANWALQAPDELNLDQEAIIRKYQNEDIKVKQPKDSSKKYIPNPKELLNNINVYKREENGFWLNMNGILEFFSTDFVPIFNNKDKNEIKAYFQQETTNIQNDILTLETEIKENVILKNIFESLEKPDEYVKAWNNQIDYEDQLETHEMYDFSQESFNEYSNLYAQDSLEEDFKNSGKSFLELDEQRNNLKNLESNLTNESNNFIETTVNQEIENIKNKYNFAFEEKFLSSLKKSVNFNSEFSTIYQKEKSKYWLTNDIIALEENISELNSKKNEIYSQNPELLNEISSFSEVINDKTIEKLENDYKLAKDNYNSEYKILARQYLKANANRFETNEDFQELCREILPSEIFNDPTILEKNIIEKIDKYLKDINLKNKKLNNRKLQKLSTIIDEVATEVSLQRNDIRQINNFLNSEDKKITGGHLVSLDDKSDETFSPNWMNEFTENMNKDFELGINDSLFESEKGISNDLEKYPSLKEKLEQAFQRSGGSKNLKPSIEALLNPKSYYHVKFSINTLQGKNNAGSNSQTYAAISLLCIAKLTLLNKQSKNKPVEAIRFMAIDEAEGLGSNFDMLYKIARANDYQLLSLSINPNKIDDEGQNIYLLHNNLEEEKVNYDPIPIFGSINSNFYDEKY